MLLERYEQSIARIAGAESGAGDAGAGRRVGHEIQACDGPGSTAVRLAEPGGEGVQLGVASLKETMANNAAGVEVEQAVVAPSAQLHEKLFIRKIEQIGDHTREITAAIGVPRPPRAMSEHRGCIFALFNQVACQMGEIFRRRQAARLGEPSHRLRGRLTWLPGGARDVRLFHVQRNGTRDRGGQQ